MRLWHFKLIPVLPRQQLLGQWRECMLIAKNIAEKGTPNHILVNPIMNYPIEHFDMYVGLIANEMLNREYHCDIYNTYFPVRFKIGEIDISSLQYKDDSDLFSGWHTEEYLRQCYYNLQEKHDRGGITDEEWEKIRSVCDYG